MVKGSSVTARNGLNTLLTFWSGCIGLQSKDGNWSRTHILVTATLTSPWFTGVTESHGTPRLGPGFLLPQDSHPASRYLWPSVPVEVFLNKGHVDVEGFLKWQFSRAFGHVHQYDLFHLMEWLSFQATADFSSIPLWQAFLCSFSMVSSLLLISPIDLATAAGEAVLYTTLDCFSIGKGSFTLDSTEQSDRLYLKITCMPYLLQAHLMSSLTPVVTVYIMMKQSASYPHDCLNVLYWWVKRSMVGFQYNCSLKDASCRS